jgi:hypothetical protein
MINLNTKTANFNTTGMMKILKIKVPMLAIVLALSASIMAESKSKDQHELKRILVLII